MSQLFMTPEEATGAPKVFGERYRGRYHLPLLPGEKGTKDGGDWVPYGVQSVTNLAGSVTESYALGQWERRQGQLGLAQRPDLAERLAFVVKRALHAGADLQDLKLSPAGQELEAELDLIHEECKTQAGGNAYAARGTNRHDVWEARGGAGSPLLGTPEINAQVEVLEALLAEKGLERVPGLQERVIRNTTLNVAGRFDDVLRATRDIWIDGALTPKGTLIMADLKTKRRQWYSLLEVEVQLAAYATAEYMLDPFESASGLTSYYAPGPLEHVSQEVALVLHMPSDGGAPGLKVLDVQRGLAHGKLARQVCDARSQMKSTAVLAAANW